MGRWRSGAAFGFALLALACGVPAGPLPAQLELAPEYPGELQPPRRIAEAPEASEPVATDELSLPVPSVSLGALAGTVAVGSDDGLLVYVEERFKKARLIGAEGEPRETGRVHALAARHDGTLLVAAANGLFHESSGVLLSSPATAAFGDARIDRIDALGAGADEELWAITSHGLLHLGGGTASKVALPSAVAVELVAGIGSGKALVLAGGALLELDLATGKARRRADGFGRGTAHARTQDGSVWFATDRGLVERRMDGAVAHHLLAPAGQPPAPVRAVAAVRGRVVFATDELVGEVDAGRARTLAAVPGVSALTVDSTGTTWAAAGASLYRLATAKVVRFAAEVRPVIQTHCIDCHMDGSNGAPKMALADYAVSSENAALILKRVRATDGTQPMPPMSAGVLSASEIALIGRWVEGGALP